MSTPSTIILITGANSGVGLAASGVIASASKDYHVIMASRNAQNGEKALAEVKATEGVKGTLSTIQLDQDDPESIKRAAKEVESQFGRLDVLVNNAGIVSQEQDTKKSLEATFRTNSLGPVLVTEAFRPLLLKSKNAYSIFVSSGLGSLGLAQDPSVFGYDLHALGYRMSKSALNMHAVQEDRLYRKEGLKTFVMCPGFVVSNLRGKDEEARNGGGYAISPVTSGQTMLSIIEGKRDADVGKFVHKDGIYPW